MLLSPLETTTDSNCLQIRFELGMILCRGMCQKCGGDMAINSYPDGTMYTVYIPFEISNKNESLNKLEFIEKQKCGTNPIANIIPQNEFTQYIQNKEEKY